MKRGGSAFGDQQLAYFQRFDKKMREHLLTLITDKLIEEHRQQPRGQHSDALERLLNNFRRPPQYGLYARVPCKEFQIIALPVGAGSQPQAIDNRVFFDEDEAAHAVFLLHIEELRSGVESMEGDAQ